MNENQNVKDGRDTDVLIEELTGLCGVSFEMVTEADSVESLTRFGIPEYTAIRILTAKELGRRIHEVQIHNREGGANNDNDKRPSSE